WTRQEATVACDSDGGIAIHELWLRTPANEERRAFSHGRRARPLSRAGVPVQGIVLDGVAALRPEAVQVVAGPEAEAVRGVFPRTPVPPGLSSWSGLPLDPGSTRTLLAGGRVLEVRADEV